MSDEEHIPDLTNGIQPVAPDEETNENTGRSVSLSASQAAPSGTGTAPPQSTPKKKKSDDPFIGRRLKGTYELEKKVGEGGMGNVYVATQYPLEREVAVKILKLSDSNPEGEHYFMREVKAINMLRHPNIINVVDFGKDEQTGTLFLVMEFLPGQTLKRIIKKEFPLDPVRICQIGIQTLNALESAHEAGIVHCDLKPANIMVERVAGQNDFIKVLDFGIAKVKEPGMEVGPYTQQGNIVGTFDYMSPEQIMRKDLDGRSDLWSLGVILYEMLTRKRIFHDKDAVSIIGRVMQMPLQPPSSHVDGVPKILDQIVMKAMERNLNERFKSADHMRKALQKAARQLEEHGPAGGGFDLYDDTGNTGAGTGSLADSGLVQGQSGNLQSSQMLSRSGTMNRTGHTGPADTGETSATSASALFTRSGSFGSDTGRMGTSVAAGTSVLDQTFSVEELKGSLLGEKRKVAVLALKQRSKKREGVDAEELARRSRQEAAVVKEVVDHFDGEIDSFLGGTFTILFGARRARVGDNVRALECAVEIQKRLRELPHGAEHIGIGLVYGDVSISKAKDGNAYGDAIDRAISIAGKSTQAAVYADESIADATRSQVKFDAPRNIGGKEAAEVLKITKTAATMEAEDEELDDLDIYVPRPGVYDQLSRRAADVKNKVGGGVAILGEMGVGKSKFIEKYVEAQGDGKWQAFMVGEDESQRQQALAPVRVWIRKIAETYRDPSRLVRKACESIGLTQHVDDVVALYLEKDLSGREITVPWHSQQEFSHFTAALLHKMVRFALKKGPVILAIDDVPVDDEPTVEFLDGLISRIQKMPVMVLVTRRIHASIRDHGLPGNFEVLQLGGFTESESKQFISQLLGHTPPMRMVQQLHMRSSGNPVFLKELVRSIRRNSGPEGLMDIDGLDQAGVPLSLHELLAERVDNLTDELRDLLRLASVLGESFREEWFFQITPSHLNPRQNLEELVAHNMLSARYDSVGRINLAFNPRALRKIVYDRLPDETRIEIHSRVIEFLESAPEVAAVDPIEVPLMLAFHYRSVEGLEGAAYYLRQGGEMLLDFYDYAGAIEHFEEAIDLLDESGTAATAEVRVKVQTQLLVALRESGRIEDAQRMIEDLPELEHLPEECHDDLLYEIGMTGLEAGSIDKSIHALQRLNERAVEKGDLKSEVKALLAIAQVFEKQNQLGQAADVLIQVPQKVEQIGQLDLSDPDDRKLFWTAYNQLGTLFIRQKNFQKAQQFLNTALQRAQQIEDHRGLVRVLSNLGALCLSMRDVKRAENYFDNARKAAEGVGDLLNQSRILTNQGITSMQTNQLEKSKKYFKKARSIAEEIGWYEGLAELSIHIKRLKQALG
ncbi:tetratricopeptide repeat protein [Persicimonas caeni]|uniref:Tetratricopeptide repeat protein n=1 Tax=Persicimonas caeni TaxID=2292766 RepID=A0A4Y6Q0R8_PERCE|nr:protein kinase [Persicimonas caeni]QDG54188.1 tetratricopeptide repeat protein [Persicimonas caeni]QED35409.1 protein kinase [Persicimonas caeni]